jgi:eukaryotic-like serine/threonine-protein kinase
MQKFEPGMILKGRYKIVSQLGQGGMGEVLLADDLSLDNQVAVKINHNLNETASNQFIREARLLASLKHPNLPRVIDYFTENDSQILVMDYVPGDDLRTIVERKDKLKPDLIAKWAVELGNALTYLHNRKPPIYHRDIKPANIKLTPTGDVVLVDFGIAKTGDPSTETQTGAWAFSPGFAPPEQVSGMRTGPYSDQFSLASTIYYLFAGKPPAESAQRMMGSLQFVPLKTLVPTVSDQINNALTKALSIKPEDRFASIADFISAFSSETAASPADNQKTVVANRIPGGAPTIAIPPAPLTTGPERKKNGIWIILGIFAVLGLLTGGYFGLSAMGVLGNSPVSPTATFTATFGPVITLTELIPATDTATLEPTAAPTDTAQPTAAGTPVGIGRGGKVAFVSNRQEDGYTQVYLMDVGKDSNGKIVASNLQQLTNTPGNKTQPSWSLDGTKLLFVGDSTEFSQNGTPYAKDIWVLDLTQANPVPVDLSQRAGDDLDPSWSPTGKLIAFSSYAREDGLPQIYTMSPDGTGQKRISLKYAEHYPVWTPNDDFLVYVMDFAGNSVLSTRDRWSLYETISKFDNSSDVGRLGLVSDPQITIDGSMIVYTRQIGTKQFIYTAVYKDRGRTVNALTDSGKDYAPCWSPDGQWVLFTSERDDNPEIYIIGLDGQNLTNLTALPSVDKDPAWQPVKQ